MGVTQEQGKFRARVYDHGKRVSLGMFDTKRKAQLAVTRWKKENDFGDIWQKVNDADTPFIQTKVDKKKPIFPPKPSILSRVKNTTSKGREWLKKQLDN